MSGGVLSATSASARPTASTPIDAAPSRRLATCSRAACPASGGASTSAHPASARHAPGHEEKLAADEKLDAALPAPHRADGEGCVRKALSLRKARPALLGHDLPEHPASWRPQHGDAQKPDASSAGMAHDAGQAVVHGANHRVDDDATDAARAPLTAIGGTSFPAHPASKRLQVGDAKQPDAGPERDAGHDTGRAPGGGCVSNANLAAARTAVCTAVNETVVAEHPASHRPAPALAEKPDAHSERAGTRAGESSFCTGSRSQSASLPSDRFDVTARRLNPGAPVPAGLSIKARLGFDSLKRLAQLPGGTQPLSSVRFALDPEVEPRAADVPVQLFVGYTPGAATGI